VWLVVFEADASVFVSALGAVLRYFWVCVISLLVGAAGSHFVFENAAVQSGLDRLSGASREAVVLPDSETGMISQAVLQDMSIISCFQRSEDYAAEEPVWMQRSIFASNGVERQAERPFPNIETLPGLVKLEQILSPGGSQRNHCAATRISENWFLTANHCVQMRGTASPVFDMLIIAPDDDVMRPDTRILPVDGAVCHAAWYSQTGKFDDDIALVFVANTAEIADIPIAQFDRSGSTVPLSPGDESHFAGWGRNGQNRFLQGGDLTVRTVGEAYILADNSGDFAPCVGDSGGPLYVEENDTQTVVGILSSVTTGGCPPYGGAFYMRVKSYENWIQRTMSVCEHEGRFVCGRPVNGS
tara:strand:+ start:59421 stop:60491 length:1071 start_codon:yes stop_codon:yes gene_type:complete